MSSIEYALDFATSAHSGQVRKYTGEEYITHPIAVYEMVKDAGLSEIAQIAAILHDTVEDTDVTIEDIMDEFGSEVAKYVYFLTKPENYVGNRATRKEITRGVLGAAPEEVQIIKFLDIYHNHLSIMEYDTNFFEGTFKKEILSLVIAMDIESKIKNYPIKMYYIKLIANLGVRNV